MSLSIAAHFGSIMTDLAEAVKQAADQEMRRSSQYATRETISLRIIQQVIETLQSDLTTVYKTRDQARVDPTVSKVIESLWKKGQIFSSAVTKNSKCDFNSMMEKFLSRDYMNPNDLNKFCQTLQRTNFSEDVKHKMWILFAFDGLRGKEYKDYARYLSIRLEFGDKPDSLSRDDIVNPICEEEGPGVTHVRAVRSIYHFLSDVTPRDLREIMQNLHDLRDDQDSHGDSDNNEDNDDSDNEGLSVLHTCIESYYRKLVGKKITSISAWLKAEKAEMIKSECLREKKRRALVKAMMAKKRAAAEESDSTKKKKQLSDDM